jgi:hypothetical protein
MYVTKKINRISDVFDSRDRLIVLFVLYETYLLIMFINCILARMDKQSQMICDYMKNK